MAVFVPFTGPKAMTASGRPLGRLHVSGQEWGNVPATDYWLSGDIAGQLNSTTAGLPLVDFGWTNTSMTTQAPSGADFASKADVGTPGAIITNAAADLLQSPAIFGDFMHLEAARYFLGQFPLYMHLEAYLRFATASNNEATTNIGFVEDGGSIIVNADLVAAMQSDGTNFKLSTGGDSDAGAVVQTTPLGLRIRIAPGTTNKVQWWLRPDLTAGFVSQGTSDLTADEFPASFGVGQGTSNVIHLHFAHIFYSVDGGWET